MVKTYRQILEPYLTKEEMNQAGANLKENDEREFPYSKTRTLKTKIEERKPSQLLDGLFNFKSSKEGVGYWLEIQDRIKRIEN